MGRGRACGAGRSSALNPEDGDVTPGTGGVRKLRWGKVGTGKRSGVRVIYFHYRPDCPLYLLLAYAKAQASDLSADEKKAVAAQRRSRRRSIEGKEHDDEQLWTRPDRGDGRGRCAR
jgi:hypothetical protein